MKIIWNKLARREWQGFYKGFTISYREWDDTGYQYMIFDENNKIVHEGIVRIWNDGLREIKRLLKGKFKRLF